jgi:hypothetical protein
VAFSGIARVLLLWRLPVAGICSSIMSAQADLAEQFFASVTRDFCRHSVDVKNPTVSAHKHHGLRETFENSAIESLRLLGRSPRATRSPFGGLSAQQLRPKIGFFERSR